MESGTVIFWVDCAVFLPYNPWYWQLFFSSVIISFFPDVRQGGIGIKETRMCVFANGNI